MLTRDPNSALVAIVFPAQHLCDRAGAFEVLRLEIEAVRRVGLEPSLFVAAPTLRPWQRVGDDRLCNIRRAACELGVAVEAVAGSRLALGSLPAFVRIANRRFAGQAFGPEQDIDLAALTHLPASAARGPEPAAVLCNSLSGVAIADRLAPRSRQILVIHDLPAGVPSSRFLRVLGSHGTLLAINAADAERLRAALPACEVLFGLPFGLKKRSAGAGATGVSGLVEAAGPERDPEPLSGSLDLLFVGGRHPPNVAGLTAFLRGCFLPYLADLGVRIAIAGAICDDLDDVAAHPGIVRLGRTRHLAPLYEAARLAIVPLLDGTGISIKTLEAIAFGKAVLATPAGLRGLPAGTALAAPFDRRWADAILGLLADPERREALSAAQAAALPRPFLGDALAAVLSHRMTGAVFL